MSTPTDTTPHTTDTTPDTTATIYEQLGDAIFFQLADVFYQAIDKDRLLRPMFRANLDTSKRHLALFLIQYFGGPATYSQQRGHPRLRMRHNPFVIGKTERDAWVAHMLDAIETVGIPEPARRTMQRYFEDAATFLINHDERAAHGKPLTLRAVEADRDQD